MKSLFKYALLLALVSILFTTSANATPANAIHAKYDLERQELLVGIEHQSSKTKEHFIKEVEIAVNGLPVKTETFTLQSSHREQTMPPIKFLAKPGDTITITAICNSGGIKKSKIVVKK